MRPEIMASKALLDWETSEGRPYSVVEKIEGGNMYLEGHPYPIKGVPDKDVMAVINDLKSFKFVPVSRYGIGWSQLCPFAQAWFKLTGSYQFAHIFHYDEAYRFRLQDLFAETTAERLSLWPCAEILRLLEINRQRDHKFAHRKFALAAYALVLFFLWPLNRKRFRTALASVDYSKLLPDDGDLYWMKQKIDYKYANTKTA